MKTYNIEMVKTISDFMFLGIQDPEKKASIIYDIRHKLKPHGFEKYMEYFYKKYGYDISLKNGTNEFDEGIDLIGEKKSTNEKLIVQCKKYSKKDITEDDVASFYGKIIDEIDKNKNTKIIYITTSKFTYRTIKFAEKRNIILKDFSNIYKLHCDYSLQDFEKDIRMSKQKNEYSKCFVEEQTTINIMNQISSTNKDVLQLLKQIRKDIADSKQLSLLDVCNNKTLENISILRPHNFESLKNAILKKSEQSKLLKYSDILLERLIFV